MGVIHYLDMLIVTVPVTVVFSKVAFEHAVLNVRSDYQGVNRIILFIFSQLVEHFRLFQQGDYLGVGVFDTIGYAIKVAQDYLPSFGVLGASEDPVGLITAPWGSLFAQRASAAT